MKRKGTNRGDIESCLSLVWADIDDGWAETGVILTSMETVVTYNIMMLPFLCKCIEVSDMERQ